MRRVLSLLALASLTLIAPAFAADAAGPTAAERRARLDHVKREYEHMLRDARTDRAARYFLERLQIIEAQRLELETELAALPSQADVPPAPPILRRTDAWLRTRIREKVTEDDVTLTDVVAWTRRELPEELAAWWTESLAGVKPLRREAATAIWEARARTEWLTASFGSGTFVVVPPKRRGPSPAAPGAPDTAHIVFPKPPTRDSWWNSASARERTAWVLAYFVERSGLFEINGEVAGVACPPCHGEGLVRKTLATGKVLSYLCPRCGGAQVDTSIRYR